MKFFFNLSMEKCLRRQKNWKAQKGSKNGQIIILLFSLSDFFFDSLHLLRKRFVPISNGKKLISDLLLVLPKIILFIIYKVLN